MRITANMTADNALYNIQKGRTKLDRLQEELSSQLNVLRPSDDPIGTRYILDLENKVKESTQYVKNIQNANLRLTVTNDSLGAMGDILTLAKSTVSNILAGTSDTTLTKMAVNQLTELKKQLIDQGNMQSGDEYIFGGFKNKLPPFRNNVWTMDATVTAVATGDTVKVADTSNLIAGMPVTQPGGASPPAAPVYIKSIDSATQVTLTGTAPAPINGLLTFGMESQVTGDLTKGSMTIKNVINAGNLSVGMKISGAGIPSDTTVTSIAADSNTITISKAATAAATATPLSFALTNSLTGKTIAGSATVYNVFDTTYLKPGMTVTGPGILPNTTILTIDTKDQITLSRSTLQTIDGAMLTYGYDGAVAGQVTGDAIMGSRYVTNLQISVAGAVIAPGMPITGPGIADNTTITAYSPAVGSVAGDLTDGTNLIQTINTLGLVVGMPMSGAGIPAGAYVSEISAGEIRFDTVPTGGVASVSLLPGPPYTTSLDFQSIATLSKSATENSTFGLTADTNNLDNTIKNISDTSRVLVGMTVTGGGFPAGTVVTGKSANTITVNNLADVTASPASNLLFSEPPFTLPLSGDVIAGAPGTVVNIFSTANMKPGMALTGPGIPQGTTIASVDTPNSITLSSPIANSVQGAELSTKLSGDLTALSPVVSNIYDTTGLSVGMPMTGAGIPADTTIKSIDSLNQITLSNNATATGTGVLLDRPIAGNTQAGSKVINGLFSTAGLLVGMPITGSTIESSGSDTVITAINSPTSISISRAAKTTALGAQFQIGTSLAVDRDYISYYGTDDNLDIDIDKGVSFTMNISGGKLLRGESTPPPTKIPGKIDIIRALDNLITAIASNDSTSIQKGVADLKLSTDQINDALAEVAGKMMRLDAAGKQHARTENTMKDLISQRQDLDMVKAGVEMTKETTAFQAALSSTSKLSQLSLLDYLK